MRYERFVIDRLVFRDCHGRSGHCRVEAMRASGGRVAVVATELRSNPGMSVTNAAEHVATQVCLYLGIDPLRLVWIEHYGYPAPAGMPKRTYDRVRFAGVLPDEPVFFEEPSWSPMKPSDWFELGLEPRD